MGDVFDADEVGVEPKLAAQYAPVSRRNDLLAVWQLDARLRRIFLNSREAALGEIKLAWWQERLGALSADAIRPEPLLRQLAAMSTIDASDLADMADGWRALFADGLPVDVLNAHARGRGRGLVKAAAAALGGEAIEPMLIAGEGYALVDLARPAIGGAQGVAALAAARRRYHDAGRFSWPRALRPLGMVIELARGDAGSGRDPREGSPARVARMAWHAVSGR